MHKTFLPACVILLLAPCLSPADESKLPFADGATDATAAIQGMLDAQSATGGEVLLQPGQYLIKGSLKIPHGVTLRGSWDEPHHGSEWQRGTTLLVTGGAGSEEGPAAIEMEGNAGVKGLTMLWPEQLAQGDLKPYPWAIHGNGMHDSVENVTLVNAYQGIKMGGPGDGSLHLIRNVFGCVLRRGIMVDNTTDIGRIENVHFNPHYWLGSGHPSAGKGNFDKVAGFLKTNLEGFTFARSDWEYVLNTFIWGAKSGYLFIKSKGGNCNGQFLGIGADFCQACVRIDNIAPFGLQITNGEFTAFAGDPNSAIVTSPDAHGAAAFVNCNFWGVKNHVLWMQGSTAVTLSDCHICDNDQMKEGAILAEHGRLIVRGCTFDKNGLTVALKPGVTAAIIAENLQPGGVRIDNEIGARAVMGLNQAGDAPAPPATTPAPQTTPQPSTHP